jgi:hypothetical protein
MKEAQIGGSWLRPVQAKIPLFENQQEQQQKKPAGGMA